MGSSSALNALKLAVLWLAFAGVGVFGFMNAGLVREVLGLRLELDDASAQALAAAPGMSADELSDGSDSAVRALGRTVELRAGAHGHFYSRIDVNGRGLRAMVDTGASIVALTFEDARSAGIHVRDGDYTHRVSTANGVARVALVTLDSVAVEDIVVRDVRAAIAEPGKLTTSLLGMSFLGQLRRTQMSRGVLVLEE